MARYREPRQCACGLCSSEFAAHYSQQRYCDVCGPLVKQFQFDAICACGGRKYRYAEQCRRCRPSSRGGTNRIDLMPSEVPDSVEIAWAAGFYEGEGSVSFRSGGLRNSIFQNEIWPLERIRRYFGGSIRPYCKGHIWYASGALTESFMETILPQLSPRRVAQFQRAKSALEEHRTKNKFVASWSQSEMNALEEVRAR